MKKLLSALLLICSSAWACGPFFPPSYLNENPNRLSGDFWEKINLPLELLYLAQEYDLVDDHIFPDSDMASLEADVSDFNAAATAIAWTSKIGEYDTYVQRIRAGETNVVAPNVPDALQEFVLYAEGYREMRADSDLLEPEAWKQLLQLDSARRSYRTTWVYYMLGNLASSHGQPDIGAEYYEDCRQAQRDGFIDTLGLAHASYKRQHMAQTNTVDRVRSGVQAVAYYRLARDETRLTYCLQHLKRDRWKTDHDPNLPLNDPLCLEAAALFQIDNQELIARIEQSPPLKTTPRLAWFMYKNGQIEKAEAYLKNCPVDDILANWLRFRIAQRNGRNQEAIQHLRKWMNELQSSDRIIFTTGVRNNIVSNQSVMAGTLGKLLVTEGDMFAALDCFTKAGSEADAALIAERFLSVDALKAYVDTFARLPRDFTGEPYSRYYQPAQSRHYVEYNLSNLLARRLFREGRMEEAMPYYSPEWADVLNTYLDAVSKADNTRLSRNERAAHLYHAARIMRWKGMELSGTALDPDYTIVGGNFPGYNISEEGEVAGEQGREIYVQTAPDPNTRFHYRFVAAELAGRAASLSRNRHQRATILWSAGEWLQMRHPKEADIYYKQLARIRFQPLGKAADELRWFPMATPELEAAFRSEKYLSPNQLAEVAKEYLSP